MVGTRRRLGRALPGLGAGARSRRRARTRATRSRERCASRFGSGRTSSSRENIALARTRHADVVEEISSDEARDLFPPLAEIRAAWWSRRAARVDGRSMTAALLDAAIAGRAQRRARLGRDLRLGRHAGDGRRGRRRGHALRRSRDRRRSLDARAGEAACHHDSRCSGARPDRPPALRRSSTPPRGRSSSRS